MGTDDSIHAMVTFGIKSRFEWQRAESVHLKGEGGFLISSWTGMYHADFAISNLSIPGKLCFCDFSLYHFLQKKPPILPKFGAFYGNFLINTQLFNVDSLVCGNYPPIGIPNMV